MKTKNQIHTRKFNPQQRTCHSDPSVLPNPRTQSCISTNTENLKTIKKTFWLQLFVQCRNLMFLNVMNSVSFVSVMMFKCVSFHFELFTVVFVSVCCCRKWKVCKPAIFLFLPFHGNLTATNFKYEAAHINLNCAFCNHHLITDDW